MTWGVSGYGSSVWGGVGALSGLGATGEPPCVFSNTKPLESGQLVVTASNVDAQVIALQEDLSDTNFDGWVAIFYRAGYYSSRVVVATSQHEIQLDRPLPLPTSVGERIWLMEERSWRGDDLQYTLAVRDPVSKRLNHATLQAHMLFSAAAFNGFHPQRTIGSPQGVHSGKGIEEGDADSFLLDDTAAPSVPSYFWTTDDSFKGLEFTIHQGAGTGQRRSVERYIAAQRRIYFNEPLVSTTDPTTVFSLSLPAFVEWHHVQPANRHPDTISVIVSSIAGIDAYHDGADNIKNTLVLTEGRAIDAAQPVTFSALVNLISLNSDPSPNPFCGLCFGLRARDAQDRHAPISVYAQIVHTNPTGTGDAVLRLWDAAGFYVENTLYANIPETDLWNLLLSISVVYHRAQDTVFLHVAEMPACPDPVLPTTTKLYLEIPAYSTNPDHKWDPLDDKRGSVDYGFLSVGGEGFTAQAQVLSAFVASRGFSLVRDGQPQAIPSLYTSSSQAYVQTQGRDTTQAPCLWRPCHTKAESTQRITESKLHYDRKASATFIEKARDSAEPVFLSRAFWALNKPVCSFVAEFGAEVVSEGHDHYNATGAFFSAVFQHNGVAKELRLAFLLDINRRQMGLLLGGTLHGGRFVSEYMLFDHDWRVPSDYRVTYDAHHESLAVWATTGSAGGEAPKIVLRGAQLDVLPDVTQHPFTGGKLHAGMYLGIAGQKDTQTTMHVYRVWGATDINGYVSHLLDSTMASSSPTTPPIYPHESPFTDALTQGVGSALTYVKEPLPETLLTGAARYATYLRLTSESARLFFTRSLTGGRLDRDTWLAPRQGFVLDFTMTLGARAPVPRHTAYPTLQETGFWTGVGLIVDDGETQIVLGFAHAGRGEQWVFVAPLPEGTTEATREQAVKEWVEKAVRNPEAYERFFSRASWSHRVPARYRVVRSGIPSSDKSSMVSVFAFDPYFEDSTYRHVISVSSHTLRGCESSGTPSLRWGNLTEDTRVRSTWGEVLFGTTSEFVLQAYMDDVIQRVESEGLLDERVRACGVFVTCKEVS